MLRGTHQTHCASDVLIAFADGELPAREASRVSTHLLECWEYRARLSSLNETAGAVARIAANHPCGGADRAAHLRHRESRHRHQHARTERHLHRRQILRQEGHHQQAAGVLAEERPSLGFRSVPSSDGQPGHPANAGDHSIGQVFGEVPEILLEFFKRFPLRQVVRELLEIPKPRLGLAIPSGTHGFSGGLVGLGGEETWLRG